MHSNIEYEKKYFNRYIDSEYGQGDKEAIEKIIKTYPNVIKMVSGWLFLDMDDLTTSATKQIETMYNCYVDLNDTDIVTFDECSMVSCNKQLFDLLLPIQNANDVRTVGIGGHVKNEEEKVNAVFDKYGELGEDFINYFRKKSRGKVFNTLKTISMSVAYTKIVDFAKTIQIFKNKQGVKFLDLLSSEITSHLLKTWGLGLGVIYREVVEVKEDGTREILFSPQKFLNTMDVSDSYKYWIQNCWDSFLSPQVKISAYAFIKAIRFKEIFFSDSLLSNMTNVYSSYKKYVEMKGEVPESLPVFLKMYNIDLPNGTDEFIKVIKTYASNNVKTDDNSEYETKLSVIEQKLEELRVNHKRVTDDLEKETVQKDGQNQEDANVVLPEDSDEWKEIKAPEGTTEWIKSFYDVFKSRNDKGEHVFAIDGLFRPIIDKCPNLRNWNDIEVELDTIRGSLKRNIKLGCYNDAEKERALTQIGKIEELVNKLNELIREKKAPQGFDGNPDPSIWEILSEDKTIGKTNIDWDNAFRDVFNKTNDGGKRIFNLLVDTVLINECPSVKNTDELYNNILTIMDIAGSDDNINVELNVNKKCPL